MKDTLTHTAPVIEARNLNLTFQTDDGPMHALKDGHLTIGKLVAREPCTGINKALTLSKNLTTPRPVLQTGVPWTGV